MASSISTIFGLPSRAPAAARFSMESRIARRALLTQQKTNVSLIPGRFVSHAWGLLCRDTWCGLARQSIHGSQELVCNSSCFSQSTQQSTMNRGWVVADCMFSSKEEPWNWLLGGEGGERKSAGCPVNLWSTEREDVCYQRSPFQQATLTKWQK